jgi:hypothetical protein
MEKTNLSTTKPSNQKPSEDKEATEKTLLHRIYNRISELLLPPQGITVSTNLDVMTYPPAADILLRRENESWTDEQLQRLPDGIRDSTARHILIEFKATESLSKEALIQAAAYEHFYKNSQKLNDDDIQTFVICSIQPQKANREQYGYKIRVQPGVYLRSNIAFNHITLISLNELPDVLHNAWTTCLASKKRKRLKAFQILQSQGFKLISKTLKRFLIELWQRISTKGDDDMALNNLSPQEIEEFSQMWGDVYLSTIPLEERLKGLKPEERLMGLKPEERLMGLKPEERLMGLKPEERLMGLKPEERFIGLKPSDIVAGLSISEVEELEKQIKKRKQKG